MCFYGHAYKIVCPCMTAYIHVYLYAYIQRHVFIHACMQYVNMCMYVICPCMYIYTFVPICRLTHVCLYTYLNVYITIAYMHRHTYICHRSEYEYRGNEYIPISYGIFAFWWEKYLHYSTFDDVITLHH